MGCGDNSDCTFELVDFRPDPDILVQIDRCTKYVKKHIRDCVGHSMQRWYMSDLTEDDVAHMSIPSSVPDRVAYYVAASVQCHGVGSCSGEPYRSWTGVCKKYQHFKQNQVNVLRKAKRKCTILIHRNLRPPEEITS